VTVSPGAIWALNEGSTFVNAHDGTLALQLASKMRLGVFELSAPCCQGAGKLTAGGTLSPTLVGGFKPAAGSTFGLFQLQGGQFVGTFTKVGGGFAGDYSHEAATPAYAGVVYGASAGKRKG